MKPEYKNQPDYPEQGIRDIRDIETIFESVTNPSDEVKRICFTPCAENQRCECRGNNII